MMHMSLEEQEAARQAGKKYYPVAIIKPLATEQAAREMLREHYPNKKFQLCHEEEKEGRTDGIAGPHIYYGFIG